MMLDTETKMITRHFVLELRKLLAPFLVWVEADL